MNEETGDALRLRLNAETGKLPWSALELHYTRGSVVRVAAGMDLVEVAACFAEDRREDVAAWLKEDRVAVAGESDREDWIRREPLFWAVVVAPWVLVQEVTPE